MYDGGFMTTIFAFTLHTNWDYYEKGDCVFTNTGDTIGRIIRKSRVDIPGEKVFYTYDVESTKENFERIKSGDVILYKIKNYSVSNCSTLYYTEL